jgi:hypothetical protein
MPPQLLFKANSGNHDAFALIRGPCVAEPQVDIVFFSLCHDAKTFVSHFYFVTEVCGLLFVGVYGSQIVIYFFKDTFCLILINGHAAKIALVGFHDRPLSVRKVKEARRCPYQLAIPHVLNPIITAA